MWRDDQAVFVRTQSRQVAKGRDRFGGATEVQQQNMLAFDRALDSRNESHTTPVRVCGIWLDVQLPIMQGNGKPRVTELTGPIDQLIRRVRDLIRRIIRRV